MRKQIPRNKKRIVLDVEPQRHNDIKSRAAKKGITMREWLLMAIVEKITREMIDEI